MNASVIAALVAAVKVAPDNVALRLQLVDALVLAEDWNEALAHVRQVLDRDPVNIRALGCGVEAAAGAGDTVWVDTWTQMLQALSPKSEAGAPDAGVHASSRREAAPIATTPDVTAELDAFLEEVLGDEGAKRVTLGDVAGLEDVKRRVETSFLAPMRNPELRKAYKKSLRGGLLLYGPPGCGKTFLARAIAGELGASFFSIGLDDVLDMWVGNSEKNLHKIFETARRRSPCVLFFDEVDALGAKRSNLSLSATRNVVAQLLAELDGLDSDNEGLFVLGATNAPWDMDSALRRPGRFDRTLLVSPPDAAARQAILQSNLRDRPVETLDMSTIAKNTDGFSGADLKLVCDAATELAMEEAVMSGAVVPVGQRHLQEAAKATHSSVRSWFETANNYAMFANGAGEYDDLLDYIRKSGSGAKRWGLGK